MFSDAWLQCGIDPWDDYEGEGGGIPPDPLYYHIHLEFNSLKRETEKAYLFVYKGLDVWIPKSWVKKPNNDGNILDCYVWREGFLANIERLKGGNFAIKRKLCSRL
ncbi:hypothetical protein LAh8_119 [Aeromonas phage LAh_8]|uniref:Uncharacterized protein n=3 Tax=Lahexavirus TaxID=2843411 RepID=A0A513ZZW9_9CAUD|nr:hypothetical protein HWC29_gp018 [Aeromonas phage 4_4572]YP_009847251.1 hypothetical protein HWC30_gp077 [Aeromonas phage LAh_6]YP_009847458.1 hypothetical protein HWC31_gp120 [Aeromonas phage LAh_8]QDH46569.1 hypothetical protein LAh6_77 [Aeromonas phage LAh_6]QDH46805.1 hypothetical protein LAh8_119 [Aeromonas phage LAh_8]QEG09016.1 hypothetical protein [Aeromonas phage 4_4572]